MTHIDPKDLISAMIKVPPDAMDRAEVLCEKVARRLKEARVTREEVLALAVAWGLEEIEKLEE